MSAPITQRDVARACGVHPSTVCLALRDSPAIPAETRKRIQETALKLQYQPNAAARDLSFLRNDKRESNLLPLAWVSQELRRDFWREDPEGKVFFEAAARRAAELGYYLDEFWALEPGMRTARLTQVIAARGIQGVVIPVYRSFDSTLNWANWEEFAQISFNDLRASEWFDVVCPDYYHNADLVLESLRWDDSSRIGLVLGEDFDRATSGLPRSCFLRRQIELPAAARIPSCQMPGDAALARTKLAAWFAERRPEVVVCRDSFASGLVRECCPGAEVLPLIAGLSGSGVDQRPAEIAAMAVDYLTEKIRRFKKGSGGVTQSHLLKGQWKGASLGTPPVTAV